MKGGECAEVEVALVDRDALSEHPHHGPLSFFCTAIMGSLLLPCQTFNACKRISHKTSSEAQNCATIGPLTGIRSQDLRNHGSGDSINTLRSQKARIS